MQRGGRFSNNSKGSAELVEVGEKLIVRFKFETFDKSEDKKDRRGVTVKGEATCAWIDIF